MRPMRKPNLRRRADTGKWYARAYLGTNPVTHAKVRHCRQFDAETREEAQAQLDEWWEDFRRGHGASLPVADAVEGWLATLPARGVDDATAYSYRRKIERYVLPYIGGMLAGDVRPQTVTDLYAVLVSGGRLDGMGVAAATLCVVHSAMSKMYDDWAVPRGFAESNPFRASPRPHQAAPESPVLSADEYRAVVTALDRMARSGDEPDATMAAAALTALYTGLRRGELCGLRRRDVELRRREIRVRCQAVPRAGRTVLKEPKRSRRRTVPMLPSALAPLLERQMDRQAARIDADGDTPVFDDGAGGPTAPDALGRWWAARRDALGLPRRLTLHKLRHTFASNLLAEGTGIRDVQAWLGHADPATTLRVYAHAMPSAAEAAARRYDEMHEEMMA